ncbi:outer membrane receptor protein involved in Fe transport [Cecembia calidifontis]|uniref:Outer membrane receptor protein involved in Fe transport n=2 Tax=Cecembia calidifontis TaxID=1187080 RepID=A0A4Q7P6S0_9BACT|nr:outer membrane receptor protein involved in Fe transport [Cecembia calidifontis]
MQSNYKIFLIFLFSIPLVSFAQEGVLIEGKVIDKNSYEPLPFASIRFFDAQQKMISGTTTDDNGSYSINIPDSNYLKAEASFVGFSSKDTVLHLNPSTNHITLNIQLVSELAEMDEVLIQGDALSAQMKLDKQEFAASQLGNTVSGTGMDVLSRLPSVTVNAEGNIMMRGNAEFLVTVNGVISNQSPADILAQIPANMIEKVELLTSPSARMDADGKAGIINIVTKKEFQKGWGMVANGNFSNFDLPRYGSDITLHHSSGKFTSFLSGNFRRFDIGGSRIGEIRTLVGDTLTWSPSSGERPTSERIWGLRGGTTYSGKNNLIISASGFYGQRRNDRTANLVYNEYSVLGEDLDYTFNQSPDRTFLNENLFVREGKFLTTSIDANKTFENKHRLSFATVYERSTLGGPLSNRDTDLGSGEVTLLERSIEVSPLNGWRIQGDYLFPVGDAMSVETGYLWKTVRHQGDFLFERFDNELDDWYRDPDFNDVLDLRQTVQGGYIQVNGKFRDISFSGGLRGEHTYRNLVHQLGETPYLMDRFDFFPSFQALWKLSKECELRATYSKRIDRPTTRDLAPFKNHRHSEAIWQGDPDLQPEISHNFEMGLTKHYNPVTLIFNAYHNRVSNLIFRVNQPYNRIILLTLATNAGDSQSTGLEAISDWEISDKFKLYLSGNLFYFQINNIEISDRPSTSSFNYNLNSNISYKPAPRWKVQWDATYLSKSVTAQGFDTDLLLSNIGLNFVINSNLSTDLIFQNIFNTNFQTINTRGFEFLSSTEYGRFDRIIQLSLTYNFNGRSKSAKQVKTEYGERDF